MFLLSKWDEDGEARVPETRRSRYRVRARYRERHTNNATEMSPYDSLPSSFCSFTFVRCIFPQSSECSGTNRKSPVNSGGSRTIDDFRAAEEYSNDRKTIWNLIGADRPYRRCFWLSLVEKSSTKLIKSYFSIACRVRIFFLSSFLLLFLIIYFFYFILVVARIFQVKFDERTRWCFISNLLFNQYLVKIYFVGITLEKCRKFKQAWYILLRN